jgi:spermidine/putrescine transport system substrate-binding protein
VNPKELKSMLAKGGTSRREALKYLGAAGLGLAMAPVMGRSARAATVSYFTWGGYDVPEMFQSYVDAHGKPDMPVFADAEEAFQKLRAGFVADVIHPCSGDTPRWRDAGIIQAIDTSKLSNFGDLAPGLVNLKGTQYDGEQWFMPWEWGQTSILYRTDLVDLAGSEESWGILWDKKYAGKVALLDAAEDAWWCAAIYAGVDVSNLNDKDLIVVSDEDIQKVRDVLTEQRELVRMYTSDMTSVEQALASGELVAAMTWNESALNLRSEGVPVKFADPKEGALTWCCGVVLHAEAPNPDLALELIDSMISPETGVYCIGEVGYGHSNVKAFEGFSDADLSDRGLTRDPGETLARGHNVGGVDPSVQQRINRDWEEITAGF